MESFASLVTANSIYLSRLYFCRAVLSLQQNQEGGAEVPSHPSPLSASLTRWDIGCHGWMSLHGHSMVTLSPEFTFGFTLASRIFGRCIFLVSVASQLPLKSSAHVVAASVPGAVTLGPHGLPVVTYSLVSFRWPYS